MTPRARQRIPLTQRSSRTDAVFSTNLRRYALQVKSNKQQTKKLIRQPNCGRHDYEKISTFFKILDLNLQCTNPKYKLISDSKGSIQLP